MQVISIQYIIVVQYSADDYRVGVLSTMVVGFHI